MFRFEFIYVVFYFVGGLPTFETANGDFDPSQNTSIKCMKIMNNLTVLTCDHRLRLLTSYNNLRDEIASGKYQGHPSVGNMLRTKWLLAVEKHVQERILKCDTSLKTEIDVSISGDPYYQNLTYKCTVMYKNRLFKEWTYEEVIDFLLEASFRNNYFGDFDGNENFLRVSLEGVGCSIILDSLGVDLIQGFMGCGFCNSGTPAEAVYETKPCTKCASVPTKSEFIPLSCDFYFRSLCISLNSFNIPPDDLVYKSEFHIETGCDATLFLVTTKLKSIPREKRAGSSLFFKITYVLPIMTIGLLFYYIGVIKGQKLYKIQLPLQLQMIRKNR